MIRRLAQAALAAMLVTPAAAWTQEASDDAGSIPYSEGPTLSKDVNVRITVVRPASGAVVWTQDFQFPGERYSQLVFTDAQFGPDPNFSLVIRDPTLGEEFYRYGPADFVNGRLATGPVFAERFQVRVETTAARPAAAFTLAGVAHSWPQLKAWSIVPSWDAYQELAADEPARKKAQAIAKLHMPGVKVSQPRCTGFLIAPTVLLTAHHCIAESAKFFYSTAAAKRPCDDVRVQFDYFAKSSAPNVVACATVEVWSKPDDFAVLRLAKAPAKPAGGAERAVLALANAEPTATANNFSVLHHPAGAPLKLSACRAYPASQAAPGFLTHRCSTLGGSSGAPLLDANLDVVGIHTWGPYRQDSTHGEVDAQVAATGDAPPNRATRLSRFRDIAKGYAPQ